MRLVIHDLQEEEFKQISNSYLADDKVLSARNSKKNCIGCFGCWTKTPGQCVLEDEFQKMGEFLAKASEVIIISECIYGGYSPDIKSVVDRCSSFLMPFFATKNGETHHQPRYSHTFPIKVHFYGNALTVKEKKIAEAMIAANQKNYFFSDYSVSFADSWDELKQGLQETEG